MEMGFVSDIKNPVARMPFQNRFKSAAQITDAEKLQIHFAIARNIKFPVQVRALETKRFAIDIVFRAVQIGRSHDIRIWNGLKKRLFCGDFIQTVVSPKGISSQRLHFRKRTRIRFLASL